MKKNFVYYLLVAMLLLALPACKKKENGPGGNGGNGGNGGENTSEVKSLKIGQSAEGLQLTVGETTRLSVTVDPSTATVTYKSSDESVVTVDDKANVVAVGVGEADIVATAGDKTAECHVTVVSALDALTFTSAYVYVANGAKAWDEFEFTNSKGETAKYKLEEATFILFSEGLFLNEDGDYDGVEKGYVLRFTAPLVEDEKYWYCLGEWLVGTPSEAYLDSIAKWQAEKKEKYGQDIPQEFWLDMMGAPGQVDEANYLAKIKAFISGYNVWAEEGFPDESTAADNAYAELGAAAGLVSGATVSSLEYHTTAEGYSENGYYGSSLPDAIVESMYAYLSGNATAPNQYMIGLDFMEAKIKFFDGIYGVDADVEEESQKIVVNDDSKILFEEVDCQFGTMPQAKPAKRMPLKRLSKAQYEKLQANLEKVETAGNPYKRVRK